MVTTMSNDAHLEILKTALQVALAETGGHRGRIQLPDQEHARQIAEAIDSLIAARVTRAVEAAS